MSAPDRPLPDAADRQRRRDEHAAISPVVRIAHRIMAPRSRAFEWCLAIAFLAMLLVGYAIIGGADRVTP